MKNIDFDKIVIDRIDMVTGINKSTGALEFMFDEIKDGSIENAAEKVFGTGSGDTRLSALNRNKTAKFTCNNGYIIGGAVAAQTGSKTEIASETNKFIAPEIEIITVGSDATKITLNKVPVGATGKEIAFIYKANKDLTQGESFAIGATASATEFSLAPSTKIITLPTGKFEKDENVIVIYNYEATEGKKISNNGNVYAKNCKIIIDLLCRDVCDNETVYHTKFVFPNASVDGNFNITIGKEPAVHAFSSEAMQNVCSKSKELWSWYIV